MECGRKGGDHMFLFGKPLTRIEKNESRAQRNEHDLPRAAAAAAGARGPFLETPDNFPGPKTILSAQYSSVAIQFLDQFGFLGNRTRFQKIGLAKITAPDITNRTR